MRLLRIALLLFGVILLALTASNMVLRQKPSEAYWIVFNIHQEAFTDTLYRINPDGSDLQIVVESALIIRSVVWSPRSDWLLVWAYADTGFNHLYKVNIVNRSIHPIDTASNSYFPAISPDETQIAYLTRYDTHSILFIADIDGSNPRQLTDDDSYVSGVEWSPTGEWLALMAFTTNSNVFDIFSIRPDGTSLTELSSNTLSSHFPKWSPNGEWVSFIAQNIVYLVHPDGSNLHQHSPLIVSRHDHVSWSPDGEWLVADTYNRLDEDIHILSTDGSEMQEIRTSPVRTSGATWSPDGKWILYHVFGSSYNDHRNGLYRMRPDGSHREQLAYYRDPNMPPIPSPLIDLPIHTSRLLAFSVGILSLGFFGMWISTRRG